VGSKIRRVLPELLGCLFIAVQHFDARSGPHGDSCQRRTPLGGNYAEKSALLPQFYTSRLPESLRIALPTTGEFPPACADPTRSRVSFDSGTPSMFPRAGHLAAVRSEHNCRWLRLLDPCQLQAGCQRQPVTS
jgi:hypothetical protein